MPPLLTGLTVVEASRGVAVRYCGRLFAQLGATVVRAEGGDDRAIGYGGEAGEAYGRWLDQGKRAGPPAGDIDLVVGGQSPADVERAASLVEALPGQPILLGLTWFHPEGAYAAWRGTDEIIHALSGMAYCFGLAEGPPTLAQGHGPQVTAGVVAFNAGLAAMFASTRPRRIAVNVLEAYVCLSETAAMSALFAGGVSVRLGVNRYVPSYPCTSYCTADGWVGVTALTPAQWTALCGMVGRPDLAGEARFATSVERLLAADEIDGLIANHFLGRTTDEWVRAGDAARVPVTPMPDLRSLPNLPHWRGRGTFAPFDDSGVVAPVPPFRIEAQGPAAPPFRGAGPEAPLKGLRVVDFTMGWAGPLCTRTLADLGAEVIKNESEAHMDWWS